jgi:GNAT superfamily N-acetyltransferase
VRTSSALDIRRARDTDREAIWRVHSESIRGLCAGWYGEAEIGIWVGRLTPEVYRGAILNRVVLVAEQDGEMIGFGQLDLDRGEVEAVYVVPGTVRRGVGSRLLRSLEEVARSRGLGRLRLCASLNAQAFYAARGYRPVQKELHRLTDTVALDCIRMDKAIAG